MKALILEEADSDIPAALTIEPTGLINFDLCDCFSCYAWLTALQGAEGPVAVRQHGTASNSTAKHIGRLEAYSDDGTDAPAERDTRNLAHALQSVRIGAECLTGGRAAGKADPSTPRRPGVLNPTTAFVT